VKWCSSWEEFNDCNYIVHYERTYTCTFTIIHPHLSAPLHSDSIEYQFVLVNIQNNVMSSESRLFKITVITLCRDWRRPITFDKVCRNTIFLIFLERCYYSILMNLRSSEARSLNTCTTHGSGSFTVSRKIVFELIHSFSSSVSRCASRPDKRRSGHAASLYLTLPIPSPTTLRSACPKKPGA
jgi:hypothetical protein